MPDKWKSLDRTGRVNTEPRSVIDTDRVENRTKAAPAIREPTVGQDRHRMKLGVPTGKERLSWGTGEPYLVFMFLSHVSTRSVVK